MLAARLGNIELLQFLVQVGASVGFVRLEEGGGVLCVWNVPFSRHSFDFYFFGMSVAF